MNGEDLIERLQRDRYNVDDCGEGQDRWHRASWNAGIDHALEVVAAHVRAADAQIQALSDAAMDLRLKARLTEEG